MKDERKAFGEELARLRLSQGLSLEDVARDTKIRQALLEALEAGQFDRLPPPVFVAGYLQACAKRMGMDPDPLVSKYKALVGHEAGEEEEESPKEPSPSGKAGGAAKVVLTIVMLGAAVAAAVYLWHRLQASGGMEPAGTESASLPPRLGRPVTPEPVSVEPAHGAGETAPAPPGPGAQQAAPVQPPVPQEASPQPSGPEEAPRAAAVPAPQAAVSARSAQESPGQGGDLVLQFSRPCWVELWADGRRKVYRQVGGGEKLVLAGKSFKAVTIGDSGAVSVVWHGEPLPFPAGVGKVVHDLEIPPPAGPGTAVP